MANVMWNEMKTEEINPDGMCNKKCEECTIAGECDPPCVCLICERQADCNKKPSFCCDNFEVKPVKAGVEK